MVGTHTHTHDIPTHIRHSANQIAEQPPPSTQNSGVCNDEDHIHRQYGWIRGSVDTVPWIASEVDDDVIKRERGQARTLGWILETEGHQ